MTHWISRTQLQQASNTKPAGYFAEVMECRVSETETHIAIKDEDYQRLRLKYSGTKGLVGTELKKLISWFPVPGKNGCRKCQSLERRMNNWGPDTCETKMDFILKKLSVAAARRKIPFSKMLVKILVRKAIRSARR